MGSTVRRKLRKDRRGTATVEFAVVLPVILMLLLGIWEVGRMVEVEAILYDAAGVGGRTASIGLNSATQVQAAVTNYLTLAGVPTQNATVTVSDLTNAGTDPTAATTLDQIQVSVSIPFSAVRWSASSMFLPGTAQLSATVTWYSANAYSYPTNITVPAGS
jgi:Flp pilus assembly protein TadG